MITRLAVPLSLGLVITGCATEPATVPIARCNVAFCGGNSPIVGHYGIDDQLNLDFQQNKDGFTVLAMSDDTEFYDLEVIESRIYAYDAKGNKLTAEELIGMKIWLDHDGVEQFAISIEGVDTVHEVVGPWPGGEVPTYLLDWGTVASAPLPGPVHPGDDVPVPVYAWGGPVCPEPIFDEGLQTGSLGEWDELTRSGIHFYDAIFFEGDRIDAHALTIDPMPDDRWFNIGCGAHMLAKLRLTRSTIHFAKDWQHVQATMKMLGGDYCGTGARLTVHGEPLVWTNYGEMSYFGTPRTLEARWSPDGAICLGEPRLTETDSQLAQVAFPDIQQAIIDECNAANFAEPPPCNDWDPTNQEYSDELVTSANPIY